MTRPLAAAFSGIAFALIAAAPSISADLVVLESNVAGISAGSVIAESEQVRLEAGARLVMIAADGSTKSVRGPYSGPIGRGTANAPGALQRLTEAQGGSDHVVGAIRAPNWDKQK